MPVRRLALTLLALVSLATWTSDPLAASTAPVAQARVAVAANFSEVAALLAAQYGRQSGNRITLSAASTGKLYAQIHNGAPFDVLLAADDSTPTRLVDEGLAVRSSLHDYAVGRLVLWSRDPALVHDGETLLRSHTFRKFALANPALAPYGAAAREVLQHVGRWDALKPRLVFGENVGQATQFVLSGNAEAGLLPRSLAMEAQRQVGGSCWPVPASWHQPIIQRAVLLNHGRDNPAAIGFLAFLRGDAARHIIAAHGYD